MVLYAYPYTLKELKSSTEPDIDGWIGLGGGAVKRVGHREEVVWPYGEKLPVVRSRCWDGLVHLERLGTRVPLVNNTVNVVISIL